MVAWPCCIGTMAEEDVVARDLLTSWCPALLFPCPTSLTISATYPLPHWFQDNANHLRFGLRFEATLVRLGSTFPRIPCSLASGRYNCWEEYGRLLRGRGYSRRPFLPTLRPSSGEQREPPWNPLGNLLLGLGRIISSCYSLTPRMELRSCFSWGCSSIIFATNPCTKSALFKHQNLASPTLVVGNMALAVSA